MIELAEMIKSTDVTTRDHLVTFVKELRNSLRDNPDEWENPSLDRFLEAMVSWLTDVSVVRPLPAEAWAMGAAMLAAAKLYE